VQAERAFLHRLEGGCQVPIAAYGEMHDQSLRVTGLVADVDGRKVLTSAVSGPVELAETLGRRLADDLISQGADIILKKAYSNA
jgi:hydroxymethylbilane synthase